MIALACDHGGFELIQDVKVYLDSLSLPYKDFGTFTTERCDYPQYAAIASRAIASGECDKGVFVCSTGIGMSIAANKFRNIRAAHCTDCYTAEMTRRHNDANVLALGSLVTGTGLALKIVETFLHTDFDGGRHSQRIAMFEDLRRAGD